MTPYLIVNPASASGRTGRHFDGIARAVRDALGEFECAFTKRAGHAAELAREAARCGGNPIVAVGGDGTASEVIDGLLSGDGLVPPDVVFGFIPRGTGGDLKRSLGLAGDTADAVRALASGPVRRFDVGRAEIVGHDGKPRVRHFANVADFGVGGLTAEKAENGFKALGGRVAFTLATARALLGYSDQPVRYRLDDGPWLEERVTNLSVCNGRYFGAGMMVAPEARVDDGLFDVVVWRGFRPLDLVLKRRMLYDGTHVRLPNTRSFRARVVEAVPLEGARVLVDLDGEQPGTLPARFTILPGALRVRVAS